MDEQRVGMCNMKKRRKKDGVSMVTASRCVCSVAGGGCTSKTSPMARRKKGGSSF